VRVAPLAGRARLVAALEREADREAPPQPAITTATTVAAVVAS